MGSRRKGAAAQAASREEITLSWKEGGKSSLHRRNVQGVISHNEVSARDWQEVSDFKAKSRPFLIPWIGTLGEESANPQTAVSEPTPHPCTLARPCLIPLNPQTLPSGCRRAAGSAACPAPAMRDSAIPKLVTIPWQSPSWDRQDTAWVGQSTPAGQAEGDPLKGTPKSCLLAPFLPPSCTAG